MADVAATLRAIWRQTALILAVVVGVIAALALAFVPNELAGLTRTLIAWDAAVATYLIDRWD